jgi:hypothetical protein
MVADSQSKRQRILHDHGIAADVSFFAHATELMHAGIGADVCAIFDDDVAGERGGIRHDYTITDQAIVSDVGLGHDQTIVTDARQHPATGSAAMDRYELAYVVVRTDLRFGWFAFVLQILRSESNRDEGKHVRACSDGSASVDDAM